MKLLVATTNSGKLRELERLFSGLDVQLVSLRDVGDVPEVVEDLDTFEGNARKKAREIAEATGLPTLADDSGLEVDVLDGAPGVRSARYSGESATDRSNNDELLEALRDVPGGRRTARFRCVLALCDPGGPLEGEHVEHGACEGRIARAPRGEEGFGYDPLFVLEGTDQTLAEVGPERKSRVSHRARAAERMRAFLAGYLARRG